MERSPHAQGKWRFTPQNRQGRGVLDTRLALSLKLCAARAYIYV
jgi:hypothetical protein